MDFFNKQKPIVDFVQTFYLDANRVENNATADITYVDLYFRSKPDAATLAESTGLADVTIFLCEVSDGRPQLNGISSKKIVVKGYNEIAVSSDATAATRFNFSSPVTLQTSREYGIAIVTGGRGYELWMSRAGDRLVGTNDPSPGGSLDHKGDLFVKNNVDSILGEKNFDNVFTKRTSIDLKFSVSCARYNVSSTVQVDIVNDDYEFLTVSSINGSFLEGEWVYRVVSDGTGTVSVTNGSATVTGTGTTFTTSFNVGDYIVIKDSVTPTGNTILGVIDDIANNTSMTLAQPAELTLSGANYVDTIVARLVTRDLIKNKFYLDKSTANTSVQFTAADSIIGVYTGANCTISSVDSVSIYEFIYASDPDLKNRGKMVGTYYLTAGTTIGAGKTFSVNDVNYREDAEGILLSKSTEMNNVGTLFNSDGTNTDPKSFRLNTTLSTTDPARTSDYEAPQLDLNDAYLGITDFIINNTLANEHTDNGSAAAKHISKRMNLAKGDVAEDVRVIYNAYKPYGTNITSYARIVSPSDPDPFNAKDWTKLELVVGNNEFSTPGKKSDIRQYEFQFPKYPDTATTLQGTATINGSNTTVDGANTAFAGELSAGDIIKIYDPIDKDIYGIFVVDSITNATSLELTGEVANTSLQKSGLKIDTFTAPNTGWLNPDNFKIVRYITKDGDMHDGWSAIAIKTVFTSEGINYEIPFVEKMSVIGVSS